MSDVVQTVENLIPTNVPGRNKLVGWISDLPQDLQSRKVMLTCLTIAIIAFLAIVGELVVRYLGANGTLFSQGMNYTLAAGTGGTVAQAVPDALQARNGTYRPLAMAGVTSIASPSPVVSMSTPTAPIVAIQPVVPVTSPQPTIPPPTPAVSATTPSAPKSFFGG